MTRDELTQLNEILGNFNGISLTTQDGDKANSTSAEDALARLKEQTELISPIVENHVSQIRAHINALAIASALKLNQLEPSDAAGVSRTDDSSENIEKLKNHILVLEDNLAQQNSECLRIELAYKDLQDRQHAIENENSGLVESIQHIEAEALELKSQFNLLQTDYEKLKSEHSVLQTQSNSNDQKQQKQSDELLEHVEQINALRITNQILKDENEQLKSQYDSQAKQQNQASELEIQELNKRLAQYTENNESLVEEREQLKSRFTDTQRVLSELEQSLKLKEQAATQLENQLTDLEQQYQSILQQQHTLQEQTDAQQQQIETEKRHSQGVKEQLLKTESELKQVRLRNQNLISRSESDAVNIRQAFDTLREEKLKLEQQIPELEAKVTEYKLKFEYAQKRLVPG